MSSCTLLYFEVIFKIGDSAVRLILLPGAQPRPLKIFGHYQCCFVGLIVLCQKMKCAVTFKGPWKPKDIYDIQILWNSPVKFTEMAEQIEVVLFWNGGLAWTILH